MYHADHAVHIGHDHIRAGVLCEDYAWSETTSAYGLAIVSDGCSSGAATDIGARITTLAYRNALRSVAAAGSQLHSEFLPEKIDVIAHKNIWASAELLSLERNDLLATIGYVLATPTSVLIRLIGDGAIALIGEDHTSMHRFEWEDSIPFYPIYNTGTDGAMFVNAHGGETHALRFKETCYQQETDGTMHLLGTTLESVSAGMKGVTIEFHSEAIQHLKGVALFSDGITQVAGIPWQDAVAAALAYKSTTGVFVRRRLLKLTKNWQTDGHELHDDISCAVVLIDHKEEGHELKT